jgi:hypothetical protein
MTCYKCHEGGYNPRLPEQNCTPYPSTAPKVGTRLKHIVHMNSADRAYNATTYVWRAKIPTESSVHKCPLCDPLRDINNKSELLYFGYVTQWEIFRRAFYMS